MPFSSQPRKKGKSEPQDGNNPSCGHLANQKTCTVCNPPNKAQKLYDVAKEKQKITMLTDKIVQKLSTEKRGLEKAAFVLSSWISGKRK
ncbi:MAG: hypothetical protein AB1540_04440 [Bdellovibrionota bacterium]